jgi:hypothetical protein
MIYVKCAQGSDEWKSARAGRVTASKFAVCRSKINGLDARQQMYVDSILRGHSEAESRTLAGYKATPRSDTILRALAGEKVGKPSDAALDYAFRVAIERINGDPLDEGYETWAMARGHELEPEARRRHEEEAGVIVETVGFAMTDDGRFGASLDGVIGQDGSAEYKCFVDPTKLRAIHIDGDITELVDQVQGCMWITGRKWCDVCLYCPALRAAGKDLWRNRVQRNDDYIEAMEIDLLEFLTIVDSYESMLREPLAA